MPSPPRRRLVPGELCPPQAHSTRPWFLASRANRPLPQHSTDGPEALSFQISSLSDEIQISSPSDEMQISFLADGFPPEEVLRLGSPEEICISRLIINPEGDEGQALPELPPPPEAPLRSAPLCTAHPAASGAVHPAACPAATIIPDEGAVPLWLLGPRRKETRLARGKVHGAGVACT